MKLWAPALAGLFSIAVLSAAPAAAKDYGPGVSDTEIKIGHTMPYSGPVSAYGSGGRAIAGYFKKVNSEGGINGRQINFISLDDAYSPPKTVEQTRKLVEQDQVLLIFGTVGTPTNTAIHKYLNTKQVPHLMISTGASKFNDTAKFPWTTPLYPSYHLEQKIYADYILKHRPDAKIAVIYPNDDFGKDHLHGLKQALGEKGRALLVAEQSYETTDPTIDSQIIALKASGATVFVNISTPKFAAQAIRKARDIGWAPLHLVVNASSSISSVLAPAGLENSVGLITAAFIKTPSDPAWAQDEDVKAYVAFMKKWDPQDSPDDAFCAMGYLAGSVLHHVLQRAGNTLTRDNVMKVAKSIQDLRPPMLLPGITLRTTPQDVAAYTTLRLQRFDGQKWVLMN
ncbi:ABC transporter substrate-binding protein [Reyranella sp. CPCC 100927]|uniref:ABC transporter substrate-binding protein n=1 Tax=Reyranella sp. CPCC 100927 TaxID=2599616 RepID=UPI0011B7D9E0|nr:ABC transporter substrate-binding protein [Reyranella sp. CPCC 100927]TWT10593.1 ABC transporter substrate-binding protein [Reyranella sp. CPCC 100927]